MYVGLNSTELAFFAFTSNFSLILAYVPEKDSKLYSIFSKKPGTSNLQILLLWCLQIILRTVLVEVKRGKKWLESEVSGPVCQSNFGQPFLPAVLSPSPSVCLSLSLFFTSLHWKTHAFVGIPTTHTVMRLDCMCNSSMPSLPLNHHYLPQRKSLNRLPIKRTWTA